jgi:Putative zinc-finger
MNPLAQPDIHPDADSLNAFVERVLPEAERARIVAHMAECSRCREVVYLAHAAAGDEPEAALTTRAKTPSRRGWWSPAWRIVWIPAAALATVGGVFLWIQSRPTPPNTTVAQLAPEPSAGSAKPPAPAIDHAAAKADQPAPFPPQVAAKRVEPLMANSALAEQTREARSDVKEKTLSQSSQMAAAGAYSAGEDAVSLPHQTPGQEAPVTPASAPVRPALSNAQLQPLQPTEGSQVVRSRAMEAAPTPAPPNMLAVHGAIAVPSPAQGGPTPLAVQSLPQLQLKLSPQPLSNLTALRLARRPKLPSGLNAVSAASMQSQLIAVDSNGAVFLSRDAGEPWEPVPPQWAGKAIEVHAEPRTADEFKSASETVSVESASPPVPAPANEPRDERSTATPPPRPSPLNVAPLEAAPLMPSMLFKLVTDRHQTWISEDGKVWRRQ